MTVTHEMKGSRALCYGVLEHCKSFDLRAKTDQKKDEVHVSSVSMCSMIFLRSTGRDTEGLWNCTRIHQPTGQFKFSDIFEWMQRFMGFPKLNELPRAGLVNFGKLRGHKQGYFSLKSCTHIWFSNYLI